MRNLYKLKTRKALHNAGFKIQKLERVKRIELSRLAWEAKALPLSYTRLNTKIIAKNWTGIKQNLNFFAGRVLSRFANSAPHPGKTSNALRSRRFKTMALGSTVRRISPSTRPTRGCHLSGKALCSLRTRKCVNTICQPLCLVLLFTLEWTDSWLCQLFAQFIL